MKHKKVKLPPAEIVTLRIPRATLREIDAIARKQKVTRTALILFALRGIGSESLSDLERDRATYP